MKLKDALIYVFKIVKYILGLGLLGWTIAGTIDDIKKVVKEAKNKLKS